MHRKLKWLLVAGIVSVAAYAAGTVLATPPNGATALALATVGQFPEIKAKAKIGDWKAGIKTKGLSDVHVNQITIQPGGTFGWHSHPGISFVIVKSGTATFYEGDDPTCTPHVVPAGSTLFEPAGDVHIPRNEGSEPLVIVVIQLLPTGGNAADRRAESWELCVLSQQHRTRTPMGRSVALGGTNGGRASRFTARCGFL